MIELHSNELVFTFPDIDRQIEQHARAWIDARFAGATSDERARLPAGPALYARFDSCVQKARAAVSFQRTLRIPDDGKDYPLPPGLGRFPVRHVDDFTGVPDSWKKRGGVMLPMHKTEALWLHFSSSYPMALKVGAGGVCAISGELWSASLHAAPQNYVVLPEQPWLDGFRIGEGLIRQFVAVSLGKGLSVEHQVRGEESWGGLQLQAFPLAVKHYDFSRMEWLLAIIWNAATRPPETAPRERIACSAVAEQSQTSQSVAEAGFGAGGRMKQQIVADRRDLAAWDLSQTSRCFAHLCLANEWQRLTGAPPPHTPPTARDYTNAGLPWFDFDAGKPAVEGETALSAVKSVSALIGEVIGLDLPNNDTLAIPNVITITPRSNGVVREF